MQTLKRFNDPDTDHDNSDGPTVVFLHANGYPPESYRLLLETLSHGATVYTVEHRPLWISEPAPKRLSWQIYADDLIATLDQSPLGAVWLLGHSMGAVISLLIAERRPDLVRGLIAMDPVLLPRRLIWASRLLGLFSGDNMPMVKRALGRPHDFDSYEAAFDFYRGKRAFQRVSDAVLLDYVHSAHQASPEQRITLRWSGAWEACVYRSAGIVWPALGAIKMPMLGIAGSVSDVLSAPVLDRWQQKVKQLSLHVLSGGHLIPLEAPEQCAELIKDFISAQNDS